MDGTKAGQLTGPRGAVDRVSHPTGTLIAAGEARQRAGGTRLVVVLLCVLSTATIYAGLIAVVVRGNLTALNALLPWLAVAAVGACALVAISAIVEVPRRRLHVRRRRLAAGGLTALADPTESLDNARRDRLVRGVIKRLGVTRDVLEEIGDTGAHERLVAAGLTDHVELELGESRSKWQRVAAAGVLGFLRSPRSVDLLRDTLEDGDSDVAYAAAQALGQYAEPAAYEALLDALSAETIPPVRIAGLLETFQCPDAREQIERRALVDKPKVRYWAAYLLGRLGDPRSEPVIERLTHDASEDVRANAAEALASFPDEAAVRRLLADESWVVRSHAAKTAGAAHLVSLAPCLSGLLDDRSWWVRENAALALESFGKAAIPVLVPQLHSGDRFARNKAAEVLVQIGYAAQQIELLRDPNRSDEPARQILVDLGRAEALSTIANALTTASEPYLRARLIDVLEAVGTAQADGVVATLSATS